MRIATVEVPDGASRFAIAQSGVVSVATDICPWPDVLSFIRDGTRARGRAAAALDDVLLFTPHHPGTVRFGAPIPRPAKNIFAIGRNYEAHAAEGAAAHGVTRQPDVRPLFFTKLPTTVIGPTADIPYDAGVSIQWDWEVELGVVIGPGGRSIPRAQAMSHIYGYTVINDISVRDVQNRHGGQLFRGKSIDGTCPMGPVIVTADEIPDPRALTLSLRVNGEEKQHGCVADMIFPIPDIIAELSDGITLEPGDVIATGTPAGVGFARTPPEFLKPGDIVEAVIPGIGSLRNTVADCTEASGRRSGGAGAAADAYAS